MTTDAVIRRSALIVAVTGSYVTPFMGASVNVALPAIQKSLHLDAVRLSWLATIYLLAAGVSLVPMGRLADIHGRKKILGLGYALLGAGALAAALAPSFPLLLASRVIQGLGGGMVFGTAMAILTSVFPVQERGKVLGIAVSAVYFGLSSGPFIGGILTQHLTWRSLFGFIFVLSLLPLVLVVFKLKGEWAEAAGEDYDLPSALLYGLSLCGLIYGFSRLPESSGIALLGLGAASLTVFVRRQSRIPTPLYDVGLFSRNRVFAFSNLAALIHYSATFGLNFLLSLYLQYIKALSPQSAGIILIAQPIVMALGSPLAGRLSDRIEPRILATCGMCMTGTSLALFTGLKPATPVFYIVGNLVFLGFGYALFSSPNMNAIMSAVDRRHLGLASGSAATMRLLGQMFSMGIVTLVITLGLGHAAVAPEVYPQLLQSVRTAFAIFSLLCGLGILASLVRGNVRAGRPPSSA